MCGDLWEYERVMLPAYQTISILNRNLADHTAFISHHVTKD